MSSYMFNIYNYASRYKHISNDTFNYDCNYLSGEKEWFEELIKLEMYNQMCEAKRQHNIYMIKIKEELQEEIIKYKIVLLLNKLKYQFLEIKYYFISMNVCKVKLPSKKEFLIGINLWHEYEVEPYIMVQGEIKNSIGYMRSLGLNLNDNDIIIDNGIRYYYSFEKFILAIYNDFI